jgi:hypothetical protein
MFPKLKSTLKERRFATAEEIKKFATGPEGDTETSVPGLLPKLEETLGVFVVERVF